MVEENTSLVGVSGAQRCNGSPPRTFILILIKKSNSRDAAPLVEQREYNDFITFNQ